MLNCSIRANWITASHNTRSWITALYNTRTWIAGSVETVSLCHTILETGSLHHTILGTGSINTESLHHSIRVLRITGSLHRPLAANCITASLSRTKNNHHIPARAADGSEHRSIARSQNHVFSVNANHRIGTGRITALVHCCWANCCIAELLHC